MSGQASTSDENFTNVAAGSSSRENSSSRSLMIASAGGGGAGAASGGASSSSRNHQAGSGSGSGGGGSSGSGSCSGSSSAPPPGGISSSGSSRSTARYASGGGGGGGGGIIDDGRGDGGGGHGYAGGAAYAAAAGGGGGMMAMEGVTSGESAAMVADDDDADYGSPRYGGGGTGGYGGGSGGGYDGLLGGGHHHHRGGNLKSPGGIPTSSSRHYNHYANNNNNNNGNGLSPSYPYELTVYSWGRGEDGQLGIGDTSDQDEPTYVDSLRGVGVRQIACGSGHTVVLTGEGEVYTWGRGDDGRLGHGDNGWKYVPRLAHSLTGQIVARVTCGSYHTAAVSSNGDLFTWGGGMYGKLGHGNESGHSTPRRVEALAGLVVTDIACGSRHTAVVTNRGALYTWGDKENGVAGHGDTEGHQYVPKLLERLGGKRVVGLSACGFHTGCLTDAGEVYTWGEGKFGRLGHGAERNCHSPRLVESLLGKRPVQIACGGFHSAVVTQDGKMYTFGGGEHGQLGHGDKVNKVKPTLVQALDGIFLQQITCGWSHSVALTSKGEVFTWGNGDHGKLGHGSGKKVSTPQIVEKLAGMKVVRVASYNEHTACLVEPGPALARGGGSRRGGSAPGTTVPVSAGFLHDMREMVNDEEYSDVTFIVEGRPAYALRAVLAKRCEHFAAMFRSGMRECVEGAEIPIPNMSHAVFLMILEYLYTDSVKVDLEHAVELYIAADLYQLAVLRDTCCVVVRRSIGSENAAILLQSAHEAHCQVMKDIAMEYIVANFDVISKGEGIKSVSHGLLLEILSLRP